MPVPQGDIKKTKKIGFAALALTAAFGLTACGDSSSSSSAPDDSSDVLVVKTKEDLPSKCAKGDVASVGDKKVKYRCNANSEWVEDSSSDSDSKDNQVALTEGSMPNGLVIIGNQVWAGKNLDVAKNADGKEVGRCYKDSKSNCEAFGRLYTFAEAFQIDEKWATEETEANVFKKNHQGLCPDGYHIPTGNDWNNLIEYVDASKAAENYIKEHDEYSHVSGILLRSTVYDGNDNKVWQDDGDDLPGIDAFGMMLVGAGYATAGEDCEYDEDKGEDVCTIKWNYGGLMEESFYFISVNDDINADTYGTKSNDDQIRGGLENKTAALPVRCIMNMTAKEYKETDEYKKMVEEAKK